MTPRQRRYPKEEFARRGDEIYERLRPQIEEGNRGRSLALDIETGEFELADDAVAACDALLARIPDAQIWGVRVGYPYVYRTGLRLLPEGE